MHPAHGVLKFMMCLRTMRKYGAHIYRRGGDGPFCNLGQMAVTIRLVLHKFGVEDVVISRKRPDFKATQRHTIYLTGGAPENEGAIWANVETTTRTPPKHVLVLTWDMRDVIECCARDILAVWFPVTWCTVPNRPIPRTLSPVPTRFLFTGHVDRIPRREDAIRGLREQEGVSVSVVRGQTSTELAATFAASEVGFLLELPWRRTSGRLSPGRFSMTCNLVEGGVPLATVGPLGPDYDSEWMRIVPSMHALLFDVSPTERERRAAEAVNARWWAKHDAMDWPAYLHDLVIAAHIHTLSLENEE